MSRVGTYLPSSTSPLKEGKFMYDITTGNSFSHRNLQKIPSAMMSDCSMTDSLAISDILIVPGMYVVLTRTKEQRTPSYSHPPQKTL
jgi:hypothetical protein